MRGLFIGEEQITPQHPSLTITHLIVRGMSNEEEGAFCSSRGIIFVPRSERKMK